ncbi:hypothetical protein ACFU7Z_38945 [Kitasatospora sp. NPDC057518]|uniref:hypothetical protein n=1 Tax=Kitasatospora sp. NPDC057518 TaxID=3346155 RepID=UPI0036BE58AB
MNDTAYQRELEALQAFRGALRRFRDALDAVRDLSEFATRHGKSLDSEEIEISITAISSSENDIDKARDAAGALADFFESSKSLIREYESKGDLRGPGGDPNPEFNMRSGELVARLDDQFKSLESGGFDVKENLGKMLSVYRKKTRVDVLRSSLLTTAVGDFEVLFSRMVGVYYTLRPQALASKDQQFSWEDIQRFGSLEELRDFHADRQVEQLMWRGFDDWMEWLDKKLKIKFSDIALTESLIREIFQRRHVIVHNGGIVSRQYLAKVPTTDTSPGLGGRLTVSEGYLLAALDQILTLGVLLSSAIADSLVRSPSITRAIQAEFMAIAYSALQERRWKVAARLSGRLSMTLDDDHKRTMMKVNYWIARKNSEGLAVIRGDVESWDTSSLKSEFELARHALLDQNEAAHLLALKLIAKGEISSNEYNEWPLLADVRIAYPLAESVDAPGQAEEFEAGEIEG